MSSARSLCLINDSILESKRVSLETLLSATSLRELSLVDCKISDLNAISQCDTLTSLKLQNCRSLSAESFTEAISNMLQLKTCHLLNCPRLETGIIALAQSATNIHTLSLHNPHISDEAIKAVGTHCRALQHLDVSRCSRLTDDAFSTLNVTCLETLNISGTQVRGSFVKHVCTADSIMHTLECLKCTDLCSSFVPTAMCYEKLHTLRIGSAKFSKQDLLQFGARFPNVKHLVITDVRELHSDIAHIFYTHHQALQTADLTGCPVSRGYETLSSFRETFPQFMR
eukprot:gene10066-11797_t